MDPVGIQHLAIGNWRSAFRIRLILFGNWRSAVGVCPIPPPMEGVFPLYNRPFLREEYFYFPIKVHH